MTEPPQNPGWVAPGLTPLRGLTRSLSTMRGNLRLSPPMMTCGMGARGALSADMAGHLEVEFQSPLVSATTPPARSLCPRSRFEMEPSRTSVNSLIAAMVIVCSGDAPPIGTQLDQLNCRTRSIQFHVHVRERWMEAPVPRRSLIGAGEEADPSRDFPSDLGFFLCALALDAE